MRHLQVLNIVPTTMPMTGYRYVTHIMPTGLCMALTLHFGNLAYLHLSVSFIQMLKVGQSLLRRMVVRSPPACIPYRPSPQLPP